ncbi:DUF1048 domain-containing protein [Lacticaseibacillus zhaodongensis]|uniref:DUF1048 domain-containing protein n=1 Tax=Lacticaseibacillus zhaodongensis TaxID=2668065 RepID=UPI0012D30DEA|nr:DUF1048 domain-containing protein [Lacticaseibacillus zhaodongensis]
MSNFWELVTGSDMDKELAALTARVAVLPADYQDAWQVITTTLWGGGVDAEHSVRGGFSGRKLFPVMQGIVELMEETAAEHLPVQAALGEDIQGFAVAAARESGTETLADRWHAKLNADVHRELGR